MEKKTVYNINKPDRDVVAYMAARLELLGAIAWDYTDTVLLLAAQMRLGGSIRRASRLIHKIARDYDVSRTHIVGSHFRNQAKELGALFEQICSEHFNKLSYGLDNEREISALDSQYKLLVKATQMALTVIDAMRLYANECDEWLHKHDIFGHSILSEHYAVLATLLPIYAGNAYNRASETRKLTAQILINELKRIDLVFTPKE